MPALLRSSAAGILATATVLSIAVLAVLADGRTGSEADLHDGGAWLLNRSAGALGHVNRAVGEVSAVVGPFTGSYDVEQAKSVVVVNNRGAGQAVLIDTNLAQPGATMTVPESVDVFAAPDAVVLVDNDIGSIWRMDRDEFAAHQTLEGRAASFDGGPGSLTVVGRDGTVAIASPGQGIVAFLTTSGGGDHSTSPITHEIPELTSAAVIDATLVGSTFVVLLGDGRLVIVEDGDSRAVSPRHPIAMLQQPVANGSALTFVDTSSQVVQLDFESGVEAVTERLGGGEPLAPIVHAGCVWAVTLTPTPAYHFCGRRHELPGAGSDLKLSLVNNWVWLNDVNLGSIWMVREDDLELEELSDWSAALNSQDESDEDDFGDGKEEQIRDQTAEEVSPDVGGVDDDDRNDPPRAEDDTAATRRGRSVTVDVLANDHDADRDPLVVVRLIDVDADGHTSNGVLVTVDGPGRNIGVSPPEDFTGTISFGYIVSDGRGGTDEARVTVTVSPPGPDGNRPPEPAPDVATVRAGQSVAMNLLTNDNDPDGDALTLVSVTATDGQATFAPDGEVSYTPNVTSPDGEIDLVYTVADEHGAEAEGTARIVVRQAESNQAPQARHDVARTVVGRPVILSVLDNDVDPDGDPLVAQNLQSVTGDLAAAQLGADGRFLYHPESSGSHTFTYTVSDGPEVATAQIRIEVGESGANRPPVAVADEAALAIGEARLIRVLDNDSDPDGDIVAITDWYGADGLDITEIAGVGFDVKPQPGVDRFISFRYWISDGLSEPVRGDVHVSTIDREPVDYRPVARADTVDVRAGQTTELTVLRNDYDPEGRALRIVGPLPDIPEGLLRISPDEQVLLLTVEPDQQFGFQFGYEIEDPAGNRDSAVVDVRVAGINRPNGSPVAGPDTARTVGENPVTIPVLANDSDPDGDPITIEGIARQPANGTVTIGGDGSITYQAARGFAGTDSFQYVLVDGYRPPPDLSPAGEESGPGRDLGEVLVGVMAPPPANRSPVARDDDGFASFEIGSATTALNVLANDSDPDGDPISVTDVGVATRGQAVVNDDGSGVLYRPPDDGAPGLVAFAYTVADGRGGTATAVTTVELVESAQRQPPVAVDDTIGPYTPGTVVDFDPRGNDIDPDGDATELTLLGDNPRLSASAGGFRITVPDTTSDLSYRVRDAQGLESQSAFITVIVQENRPPLLQPLRVETEFNTPIEIPVHDQASDPDNDPLVVTLGSGRRGGAVQVVGQPDDNYLLVRFTPDTDFVGDATFDYAVDDRNGHTITGQVIVAVKPGNNRPPRAEPITLDTDAGIETVIRLSDFVTDPDPDGPSNHRYEVGDVKGPITITDPDEQGEVRVSSELTDGGSTASFGYTVVDGSHRVAETVSLTLQVADFAPPVAGDDTVRVLQGEDTGPIDVLANDADNSPPGLEGDGLTVVSVGVTPAGTTRQQGDTVVFEPDQSFFGSTSFTYTIQDGRRSTEGEAVGTVTIDVVGRPDTPQPPTVESVGDGYLVVNWTAPQTAVARAPVTGYELRYTASDGSTGTVGFDSPSTNHRWPNLSNGVQYCFSVAAVNEAGQGDFSPSPGGAECGVPDVRPEAPAAPIVEFGNTELRLTWFPPTLNRGTPIKNYQVRLSGGAQGLSAELGRALTHTWTNLDNGTDYTFEVRAQNSARENDGWSEWSRLSTPEHPLTAPAAPVNPTAQRGDQQVVISWTAPDNGGDPITRYDVQSSIDPTWVAVTPQGLSNTHTWQNIPNGTDVSFRVRAVNRDPSSATPGNISSTPVVRTCAVPDAPPQPTVERGDKQVTVSWSAPNDRGCAITGYQITNSAGTIRNATATARSLVFDRLVNGRSYTFQVAAINEVVTGDGRSPRLSPASIAVTPAGPPLVSNVTSATNVGVRQVRVNWSAAEPNGSPIIRYELKVNDGAWIDVGVGTTITRTEASNGATYTYRVRAVNAIGPSTQAGATKSVTTWNIPGSPNVNASPASPSSINSSWTKPSNTGGTSLTGHEAKLTTGSCGSSGTTRSNPGSPETWGGLNDDTTYRVCVRYRNQVGWGAWGSDTARTPIRCNPFTIWGQSADRDLPGAAIRSAPFSNASKIGSIGPDQARTSVGWTNSGSTPYTGNPHPYNQGIWYKLDTGGWAIIAGVRGTTDTNDFDPANAPPRNSACQLPVP